MESMGRPVARHLTARLDLMNPARRSAADIAEVIAGRVGATRRLILRARAAPPAQQMMADAKQLTSRNFQLTCAKCRCRPLVLIACARRAIAVSKGRCGFRPWI